MYSIDISTIEINCCFTKLFDYIATISCFDRVFRLPQTFQTFKQNHRVFQSKSNTMGNLNKAHFQRYNQILKSFLESNRGEISTQYLCVALSKVILVPFWFNSPITSCDEDHKYPFHTLAHHCGNVRSHDRHFDAGSGLPTPSKLKISNAL